MILITGALVMTNDGFIPTDVLIDGDIVSSLGAMTPPPGARVIEAEGMVLGPGLVDIHVHFREPGETWKEDIRTGSEAAAAGGFTAVVTMPNTLPAVDTPDLAAEIQAIGRRTGMVEVAVAGAITEGRLGENLADITGMYQSGVRIFSDDGNAVADAALLGEAMNLAADLPGAIIAQHAEDAAATHGGLMHEGEVSRALGIAGLPVGAETGVIQRDIGLATRTGAHLHVQHVSASDSVALIDAAKVAGVRVSAEVTPHHLTLTEDAVWSLDPNLKMYPPLRSATDRAALVDALKSGTIDAVATDHAPHTPGEKDVGFEKAPRGVIGLETAFPLVLESLGGDLGLTFERMSIAPAHLAGLSRQGHRVAPGRPANLVLVDPLANWSVARFRSKSSNSPFAGRMLTGKVMATIYDGQLVYEAERDG